MLNNLFSKVQATLRLTDTGIKYNGILCFFKKWRGGGKGEGGEPWRTNERPGTDHVISGPMRGLEKTATDGANRHPEIHTDKYTNMATL